VAVDDLEIDRGAALQRVRLGDGSSWVDLCPGFVRRPEELLADVLEHTDWHQGEVWRFDRYVEEQRLGAWLREGDLLPAIRQTGLHLTSRYRVRFEGVTAIQYRDGSDFQGLHSDREMRWLDDTLIAILVLGEARPFVLRPRRDVNDPAARADASEDVVLRPGHGTLMVMGGRCQQDWLHGVPADPTTRTRVSLTWRWSSRRGRPDTAPGYFEGRSYSDRPNPRGYRTRRA
jgi:alkylated DNA repair dioxygenase AlkB